MMGTTVCRAFAGREANTRTVASVSGRPWVSRTLPERFTSSERVDCNKTKDVHKQQQIHTNQAIRYMVTPIACRVGKDLDAKIHLMEIGRIFSGGSKNIGSMITITSVSPAEHSV